MTSSAPPGKEPRERGKGPSRELRRCLPMIRRSLRAIARVIPVDARGSAAIEGLGGALPTGSSPGPRLLDPPKAGFDDLLPTADQGHARSAKARKGMSG
jgi:hypothetical protein